MINLNANPHQAKNRLFYGLDGRLVKRVVNRETAGAGKCVLVDMSDRSAVRKVLPHTKAP